MRCLASHARFYHSTCPSAAFVMCAAFSAIVGVSVVSAADTQQRPICMLGEALTGSVDHHLADWDSQIEVGLNTSLNCSDFLEFVYLSRDRIRQQLDFVRGNFTAEDEMFRARGEEGGSTSWAMTHMSTAASLVSAHIHIHGVLAAARRECLSEHLQLLFLMSLRRLKGLLHNQLRQIWVIFQGTAELFRQGAGKWLTELVELFEADLRTYESIMSTWQVPEDDLRKQRLIDGVPEPTDAIPRPERPGPPLPQYHDREPDGIALATIEVLRRDTFEEWDSRKPLSKALLRYVLPRDGHVADMCAGTGLAASFLNDTGLVTAYAFDPSPNIRLLSKGVVEYARLYNAPVGLWRSFDMVLCLTAAADYGANADTWSQVWQNIEAHATQGVVLTCGSGEVRQHALGAAARYAPGLRHDADISDQLNSASDADEGVCVFWRLPAA